MTMTMKTVKAITKNLSMPCRKKVHFYLAEEDEGLAHQLQADVSKLNYQLEPFINYQSYLFRKYLSKIVKKAD